MPTQFSPPPKPPLSPPPQYNMPVFYYGLLVFGSTAIILAIYNLIIIRLCTGHQQNRQSQPGPTPPTNRTLVSGSSQRVDNQNTRLMSSFKYKKGERVLDGHHQDQQDYELECPVCLSAVEEGEEVRQLPRCKHSFHAPCIDMWLYSHFDCPVCRALVEPPVLRLHTAVDPSENSREGLIDTGNLV